MVDPRRTSGIRAKPPVVLVLSTIGMGVLLVAYLLARSADRRTTARVRVDGTDARCQDYLRQLGIRLSTYAAVHGRCFPEHLSDALVEPADKELLACPIADGLAADGGRSA